MMGKDEESKDLEARRPTLQPHPETFAERRGEYEAIGLPGQSIVLCTRISSTLGMSFFFAKKGLEKGGKCHHETFQVGFKLLADCWIYSLLHVQ
jgi:hypothetical protein